MSETGPMLPHQFRVVEEKKELDEKIEKLDAFIASNKFNGVGTDERGRMRKQILIMEKYSQVLGDRIKHFTQQ